MLRTTLLAAVLFGGAAAAQTPPPAGGSSTTTIVAVDTTPARPGGIVLFTNAPFNDLGTGQPVATADGAADGRLEVLTVAVIDTATGASLTRQVISNTPIPDTLDNRRRFGGPRSTAGKNTPPKDSARAE